MSAVQDIIMHTMYDFVYNALFTLEKVQSKSTAMNLTIYVCLFCDNEGKNLVFASEAKQSHECCTVC